MLDTAAGRIGLGEGEGWVGDGAARSMLMGRAAGLGGFVGEWGRTGRQGRNPAAGGGKGVGQDVAAGKTGLCARFGGGRNCTEQSGWLGLGRGAGGGEGWEGGGVGE